MANGLTCSSHLSKQANQTLARCDISEEEEVAKTFEDFVPTKKLKLPKKIRWLKLLIY